MHCKIQKHISKLLSSLSFILIILFSGNMFYQIQEAKRHIIEQFPILLEKAVRRNIKQKSADIYNLSIFEYSPNERKIGEQET